MTSKSITALAALALAFAAFGPRAATAADPGSDGPPAEVGEDSNWTPPPPAPSMSRVEDVQAEERTADGRSGMGFAAAGVGLAALLGAYLGTRRRGHRGRRGAHHR